MDKAQKKLQKMRIKAVRRKVNALYKEYIKNERDKMIFSLVGAAFSEATVVAAAFVNARHRTIPNILFLLGAAVMTVVCGLSAYNSAEEIKDKRKNFIKTAKEQLDNFSSEENSVDKN